MSTVAPTMVNLRPYLSLIQPATCAPTTVIYNHEVWIWKQEMEGREEGGKRGVGGGRTERTVLHISSA